ncbi:coproporphyrinogen III oxidase [Salsuginibacillus kocurii]|uniref:coproporphyrinogen III oxidase n=1 Tax=Salsuginibacillus kocurii TaxID=427078 RepID=UPI00036CAFC5|nr:coproporphyrinogen III oxidase [Salsuginibacillus kocurii]
MIIAVSGLPADYERTLSHLAAQYVKDAEVQMDADSPIDGLKVRFTEKRRLDQVYVSATARAEGFEDTASFQKPVIEANMHSKVGKQTAAHVFVKLLTSWTGKTQPWGTLTGIRPTKLYHQMYRSGLSHSDIKKTLKDDYLISDEKIAMLERIVKRQLEVLPDLYEIKKGVSIYIGIPFCPTMCAYCTFPAYAINGKNGSVSEFLNGLYYEMEQTGAWLKEHNIPVTTIYFGGGTPTSIEAEEMDALYSQMHKVFPDLNQVREVTVEAGRPDTISAEKLAVLNKWNIDRISINPQSFHNETLRAIGRHHSVEETVDKYELAVRHGVDNINMDLIIGLPNEGVPEMKHNLSETKKLDPASLTVHTLSFKRASTMTKQKDKYNVAGPEEIQQMMDLTNQWTDENEYEPYYLYRQKNILGNLENVGYAKAGKESLYNMIIMEEVQTIIGLGCGAASKWVDPVSEKITRMANPKDPISYIERYEEYTHRKIDTLNELFRPITP